MLVNRELDHIIVPPIKCQGIKTKLIKFIAENINWDNSGRWIEPFLGSGVVAFNIQPDIALLSDTNKHIINFYLKIQKGEIDSILTRHSLETMGEIMKKGGEDYYYQIRAEFNEDGDSFKFLFLNRSCFNGLMRFNSRGGFNVPFGHKQYRFSKAYITKIVNQVKRLEILFHDKDWEFRISDWKDILALTNPNDFVYLDPPYIGRHTDYFNNWGETDAIELAKQASQLKCNFALSMWLENKYRKNQHIENHWPSTIIKTYEHFYHIGASESLRNSIREALVLKEMITCR